MHADRGRRTGGCRVASRISLGVLLVLSLVPSSAHAQSFCDGCDVMATPSTLTVAWCVPDQDASVLHASVWVGEWGLSEHAWRFQSKVRDEEYCRVSLRLARSGEATILAVGDPTSGAHDSHAIEVVRLERSPRGGFTAAASTTLAGGFAPSLDASADAIVVGSFEDLPEVRSEALKPPPPPSKLHLRVLDPRTLAVVAARTLYGHGGLRPHRSAELSGRAVAILGGAIYVGVPDDRPRIATFGLPGLRPTGERGAQIDTSVNDGWSSSFVVGRNAAGLTVRVRPPEPTAAMKEALGTLP